MHDALIEKLKTTVATDLSEADFKAIYSLCYKPSETGCTYDKKQEADIFRVAQDGVYATYSAWRDKYEKQEAETIKNAIPRGDEKKVNLTTTKDGVVKPVRETKLVCLADVEKKAVEWLIPHYIPKGMITLLAGDGGTGKGFVACNLVAGLTAGKTTLLNETVPPFDYDIPSGICLYLSYEDDASHVLAERLEKAGADLKKIMVLELSEAEAVCFDSPIFEKWIAEYKPLLIVCDPLQNFLSSGVNMSARNMMRQSMMPLVKLGEKYGVTFLILMHTNKKMNVWGRGRLADSSDLWDIARSVFICGFTNDGDTRYLSHEKNSHAEREKTVLFHVEEGEVVFDDTTDKRDREFVIENGTLTRQAPRKDEAKERILQKLADGKEYAMQDLENSMRSIDISPATFRRAKQELEREGKIKIVKHGFGGNCFVSITEGE